MNTLNDPTSIQPTSISEHGPAVENHQAVCPLLDVVACDGADTSPIVVAAHALGAEVRMASAPEFWFEQQANLTGEAARPPADVVALIGAGERLVSQRFISRAVTTAPDTRVMAAAVDATLDQAAALTNQGARGLIGLPAGGDQVAAQLKDILDRAARSQVTRRAAIQHRTALGTLTPAEQDVLDNMLAGMANKQIAQRLGIGLRTVELRRSKIMRKMNATSIAQLVSFIYASKPQGS